MSSTHSFVHTSSTTSMNTDSQVSHSTEYAKKVNLEMDPDMALNIREYPSVSEYYLASKTSDTKPIQLQNGLSNYSSLQLGDDRIAFKESILTGSYRLNVEDKMTIPAPSKDKTVHSRRREYQEALEKVGDVEINRLERVMKDKLFQRSYMTSSPFQVRKAFKFFDREQSLRIHIEGFTKALEFLGFQFSERQNTALFGRYDDQASGEIDYMNFIAKAMFYGADDYLPVPKTLLLDAKKKELEQAKSHTVRKDAAAIDEKDASLMLEAEMRTIFNKAGSSGPLNRDQFELFLMAINHHVSSKTIDSYYYDLGLNSGGNDGISFDLFFEWWTSSVGRKAIV